MSYKNAIKMSMTTIERSNPMGFENTNGCRKDVREGNKQNKNKSGLPLSTEQESWMRNENKQTNKKQTWHATTKVFPLSMMPPTNLYAKYCCCCFFLTGPTGGNSDCGQFNRSQCASNMTSHFSLVCDFIAQLKWIENGWAQAQISDTMICRS